MFAVSERDPVSQLNHRHFFRNVFSSPINSQLRRVYFRFVLDWLILQNLDETQGKHWIKRSDRRRSKLLTETRDLIFHLESKEFGARATANISLN
jgi:hypothetical protein